MTDHRGGKRANAGRKHGSKTKNRRSPEIDGGILPLEMRLRLARHIWAQAVDADGNITDEKRAMEANAIAEPAMRFTSPMMSSIAHTGHLGGPIRIDHRVQIDKDINELLKVDDGE